MGTNIPAAIKTEFQASVFASTWSNTTTGNSFQFPWPKLLENQEKEDEDNPEKFRGVRLTGWQGNIARVITQKICDDSSLCGLDAFRLTFIGRLVDD